MRRELGAALGTVHAFRVDVEQVKIFAVSDVVYLSLGAGCQQIKDLHAQLNQGRCQCAEAWNFQPHITLAQDLPSDVVSEARELAERRWHEYKGSREFTLDKLAFVQGSDDNSWVDLTSWELPSPVLV